MGVELTLKQQVRNILALTQAWENGRAVSLERLLVQAASEGLARHEVEKALVQLEREGLAQHTPRGWIVRPAPLSQGVGPEAASRVRLHRSKSASRGLAA